MSLLKIDDVHPLVKLAVRTRHQNKHLMYYFHISNSPLQPKRYLIDMLEKIFTGAVPNKIQTIWSD